VIVFVKPPIRAGQSCVAAESTPAEHPALGEVLSLLHRRFGRLGNVETLSIDIPSADDHATTAESPSSPPQREPLLTVGDLTIDRRRREVEVAGRLCPLTKSEFDLLVVLAEQPGVVFSRREIVLAYKGSDYPVDDRSIDVQMVNLRRKLGPGRRYLQTIRGVGYRFHAVDSLPLRGAR
jgi:DNA-binding response OmpR family regulator